MFLAALFVIPPNCKQPKCPSRKMDIRAVDIHAMECIRQQEWITTLRNIDKPHNCNVDGKKLDVKAYIPYDSIDTKYENR